MIQALTARRFNFSDDCQLKILDQEIARLNWVLNEGPDVVLVPKPKQ